MRVVYSGRTGSLAAIGAQAASELPSAATIIRADRRACSGRGGVAMLTKISGGEIIDPVNGRRGKGDLWIRDEEIVDGAGPAGRPTGPSTHPAASSWPAPSTSIPTSAAAT